jgi:hypothetical protein
MKQKGGGIGKGWNRDMIEGRARVYKESRGRAKKKSKAVGEKARSKR